MTLPWVAPDGVEALLIWCSSVMETRPNRPSGAVLPYCMITKPVVTDDKITEMGRYRAHVFHEARNGISALKNARDAAYDIHYRILAFGPPIMGQQFVTLDNGQRVAPDKVETVTGPSREKYTEDDTIEQFVSEYRIDWRFISAI